MIISSRAYILLNPVDQPKGRSSGYENGHILETMNKKKESLLWFITAC
jgi:hypothetical protein